MSYSTSELQKIEKGENAIHPQMPNKENRSKKKCPFHKSFRSREEFKSNTLVDIVKGARLELIETLKFSLSWTEG